MLQQTSLLYLAQHVWIQYSQLMRLPALVRTLPFKGSSHDPFLVIAGWSWKGFARLLHFTPARPQRFPQRLSISSRTGVGWLANVFENLWIINSLIFRNKALSMFRIRKKERILQEGRPGSLLLRRGRCLSVACAEPAARREPASDRVTSYAFSRCHLHSRTNPSPLFYSVIAFLSETPWRSRLQLHFGYEQRLFRNAMQTSSEVLLKRLPSPLPECSGSTPSGLRRQAGGHGRRTASRSRATPRPHGPGNFLHRCFLSHTIAWNLTASSPLSSKQAFPTRVPRQLSK